MGKKRLLGGICALLLVLNNGVLAYEPSLFEAERLQTAESLLWSAPPGMQQDIEQRLLKQQSRVKGEWKTFCVTYLLYQLNMIAQKQQENLTTAIIHTPTLVQNILTKYALFLITG